MNRRDFLAVSTALTVGSVLPAQADLVVEPKLSKPMQMLVQNIKTMVQNCKNHVGITYSILDRTRIFECGQLDIFLWTSYRFDTNTGARLTIKYKQKDFNDDRIEKVMFTHYLYPRSDMNDFALIFVEKIPPEEIRNHLFKQITKIDEKSGIVHLIGTEPLEKTELDHANNL